MSRKDYQALAAALRAAGEELTLDAVVLDAWRRTVRHVADALAADNPRFDRDRFYRAAGMRVA